MEVVDQGDGGVVADADNLLDALTFEFLLQSPLDKLVLIVRSAHFLVDEDDGPFFYLEVGAFIWGWPLYLALDVVVFGYVVLG